MTYFPSVNYGRFRLRAPARSQPVKASAPPPDDAESARKVAKEKSDDDAG